MTELSPGEDSVHPEQPPVAQGNEDGAPVSDELAAIDQRISETAEQLASAMGGMPHYCMLLSATQTRITRDLVDSVYGDLHRQFPDGNDELLVILSSSGGEIDSAYNLALQLRRYGCKRLVFVVPRWAKSAATLVVCAGDEIHMTPPAELGPLDPQITAFDLFGRKLEEFSPLHIGTTLDLIHGLYEEGKEKLADALVNRLQYPLQLGNFTHSLSISKFYLFNLLSTRMLSGNKKIAQQVSKRLSEGYVDHGACILCEEANGMGLNAQLLEDKALQLAWSLHRLERDKERLLEKQRRQKMARRLRDIPPEVLDAVGGLAGVDNGGRGGRRGDD